LLQPVITALLSGVFLGETYSAWQIAGGAAVLAGVFIIQTKKVETISVPQPFL
jgi:drug/metabolite transporter (DMT)-like permease